ncbi:MAG: M28 family peptidase [Bacteroidales bacterium]|nr:M28 family peptidase [Bacteroidales bacterium]
MRRLATAALIVMSLVAASCGGDKGHNSTTPTATVNYAAVQTPAFDSDTAYSYAARQLAFGFRTPGSKAHAACAAWIAEQMAQWCDTVVVQEFGATLWTGQHVTGKNIIASLDPGKADRVLLGAHWDSRMWADHDPDSTNWRKPLPGANDGASGVAVLMEMARTMAEQRPNCGVDFIFFDVEDQGIAEWADEYRDESWCLGSQYWARHPHRPFYSATYGVLLDMVGCHKARFTKEQVSMQYAGGTMDKLWQAATALGYGQMFVDTKTDAILDDHLYVNQLINIPMVDIVQNSVDCSFYPYWHTVKDDLEAVDKGTLEAVGRVVMAVIYSK